MSTTKMQDAIIAANLNHYEVADLIGFLTGVYQNKVAAAELKHDALTDKSTLSTPDWSAANYGRSDLVHNAESFLASARHFAKGKRGRV